MIYMNECDYKIRIHIPLWKTVTLLLSKSVKQTWGVFPGLKYPTFWKLITLPNCCGSNFPNKKTILIRSQIGQIRHQETRVGDKFVCAKFCHNTRRREWPLRVSVLALGTPSLITPPWTDRGNSFYYIPELFV